MSNRLFQGLVHQMRDTIDATIGVVDETATIIACSDISRVGTTNEFVSLDLSDSHDIFIRDGFTYKPFGSRVKPDYAVFVEELTMLLQSMQAFLLSHSPTSSSTMTKSMTETTSSRTLSSTMFSPETSLSRQENFTSMPRSAAQFSLSE